MTHMFCLWHKKCRCGLWCYICYMPLSTGPTEDLSSATSTSQQQKRKTSRNAWNTEMKNDRKNKLKETRKRKLAGEMTAKSRRRTTLKSNHFILVTRSATHCLPDTSTTHASVRSHIKKPASADSDGSASLPQNNPCSSTSLEMIFTASWALPALSRPSLQHACSICVLYIRHVPNIRFVFASVPNSGPNSVFIFQRIVPSERIRIVSLYSAEL